MWLFFGFFKIKLEIIRSGSELRFNCYFSVIRLFIVLGIAFGYLKNKLRYILTSALTGYTFKLGITFSWLFNLSGSLHDQNYLASERMIITDKPAAAGVIPVIYTWNTMTRNGRSAYDDTTLFEFYPWNLSSRPKLDNNLEQRENFKAAFDHFDYKKMHNILINLIYCKMLVSYATNLKSIRQLPMHKLS
jgi:hypothetical protein